MIDGFAPLFDNNNRINGSHLFGSHDEGKEKALFHSVEIRNKTREEYMFNQQALAYSSYKEYFEGTLFEVKLSDMMF